MRQYRYLLAQRQ